MTHIRLSLQLLLSLGLVLCSVAAHSANGTALFSSCSACHGKNGNGNDALGAPAIAGQEAWYLERQLENFASGRRGTHVADSYGKQMVAAVAVLKTPAERSAVANLVASMPKVGAGGTATKGAKVGTGSTGGKGSTADLGNGRTHYNALCSSCHGANGQGNKALSAPRLSGLSTAYLSRQLGNFKQGLRGTHAEDKVGKQMAAISKLLPDAKTQSDVLAYVDTLKP